MAAEDDVPRGWGSQFPRVTNDEYLALARARLNSVQYGIVLFLITQTRGTGRLQSGEELSGLDDFEEALSSFGCESRRLFRAQVAQRIGRHPNAVARELRRLIAAGIVVELEPAQKGQAAELAVDLDERAWRLEHLAGGVEPTVRRVVPPTHSARSTVNGTVQGTAESMNRSAHRHPGTVSGAVHTSPEWVNEPVHLLRDLGERRARERMETETPGRRPENGRHPGVCPSPEEIRPAEMSPKLRALTERLMATASRTCGESS